MSSRLGIVAMSTALLAGTVACSDSTGAGTGTVGVRLTNASVAASVASAALSEADAPLPAGSIKSVDIFVVRIDAKRNDTSDDDAAAETEESEAKEGGWVTVAEPNASFDLMKLADGTNTFLGDAKVAEGAYNGFRLIIDPAKSSVTLNDDAKTVIGGESITGLKFPSAAKTGLKINLSGGPVEVEEGETSVLTVKFDVSKSFVMRGNSLDQNGLLFKPVIRGEHE